MAGIKDYSLTAASNTAINSINIGEGCPPSGINDAIRQEMADTRSFYEGGSWIDLGHTHTYSSATATTVASDVTAHYAAGRRIRAVGSGTGTIYGVVASSSYSAPNATINYTWDSGSLSNETLTVSVGFVNATGKPIATTAISGLGTAATSATGDFATAAQGTKADAAVQIGKHTLWIPAGAMTPNTTNGAASGATEMSTNKNMLKSLDFNASTQQFAQFDIGMPKSWNEGTVTFQACWTAASGSGGVVWALQGVATSDDDAMDVAFGTEQTSTDTLITANDCHWSPESSAITIGGTPAALDRVNFRIKRNVSDGSDTLGVDAKLIGIRVYMTIDASTDA
jgi:hypothetical protein